MAATRKQILDFLDSLEPPIRREFMAAIAKITGNANIGAMTTAIELNDINAVLRASGLRVSSWANVTEAVRRAYIESGQFTMASDVPARFGADFNFTNPRSEAWLRESSSAFITYIDEEQRDTIQTLLTSGVNAGRNPRSIALDIVGRVSPQTGRREGGIIGLNRPQAAAAGRAREQLEALDPAYFQRELRDRRYDSMVRKAIEADTPLSQADIDKISGRYADRLLKLRGDTIGRTEALAALNEASDESLRQVIEEGLAPPDAVKRIWRHSFGKNERPGHVAMDGTAVGVDEPFTNPETGNQLMHPGQGPASEVINCRCIVEHDIDFIAVEQQGTQAPMQPAPLPQPEATPDPVPASRVKLNTPEPLNMMARGGATNAGIESVLSRMEGAEVQANALASFISNKKIGTIFGLQSSFTRSGFAKYKSQYIDFDKTLGQPAKPSVFQGTARLAPYGGVARAKGFTSEYTNYVAVKAKSGFDDFSSVKPAKLKEAVSVAASKRDMPRFSPRDKNGTQAWTFSNVAEDMSKELGESAQPFITWLHEMGHQVHFHAGRPVPPGSLKRVTTYSRTNDEEWFAEHFAMWMIDRDALAAVDQAAAEFIDEAMRAAGVNLP